MCGTWDCRCFELFGVHTGCIFSFDGEAVVVENSERMNW